jgi:hypothetical protein
MATSDMLRASLALSPSLAAGLRGLLLVAAVLFGPGGCFLMSRAPDRPDPTESVSGPAVFVERCQGCHAREAGEYARSFHAALGIRCGQCHTPGGHPDFGQPVRDATCAGCHQDAYQQTVASQHFADRQRRALDGDRAARSALRAEGFIAPTTAGTRFAGDSTSGEMGGRLCAACHYDEHRLGLGAVQRADSCAVCHVGFEQHFARAAASPGNRCLRCHVRAGTTESGQTVNTHRFPRRAGERSGP